MLLTHHQPWTFQLALQQTENDCNCWLGWSRWLDIGLVLFLRVYGPRLNTQKKVGQYPAILTSHLVNNPYI